MNSSASSAPNVPLATPIQKLPATSSAPPPLAAPEDPSVTDVLNEMESVVSMAKNYQDHPIGDAGIAMAPPMFQMPPAYGMGARDFPETPKSWLNLHTDNGKRAAVAMILALVLFYPSGLFPAVYQRIARLRFLESYDIFVRVFLLGVFFYILLTYVPL